MVVIVLVEENVPRTTLPFSVSCVVSCRVVSTSISTVGHGHPHPFSSGLTLCSALYTSSPVFLMILPFTNIIPTPTTTSDTRHILCYPSEGSWLETPRGLPSVLLVGKGNNANGSRHRSPRWSVLTYDILLSINNPRHRRRRRS